MADSSLPVLRSSLDQYLIEINRFPLLSREEEQEYARRLVEEGDMDAARKLVTSNLRFVVKVAFEYRNYEVKLIDLIQEGNIGLMKAVSKFNPDRGYRLISYAVWWIKAYMQNYIIKNWSMVKIGSNADHRRMLFGTRQGPRGPEDEHEETYILPAMATHDAGQLMLLDAKVARRDFSLDSAMDEDGRTSYGDMLRSGEMGADESIGRAEARAIVSDRLKEVVGHLNDRERFILEKRILADEPLTLQEIGERYGVTRERVRQLENSLKKKLARSLTEFDEESAEVIDL
ncbi:MAG: RNA polymerase sigma factor RpoD [Myxococcales bacterium]